MASLIKDWRARADWETLIFLAGGAAAALRLPVDRFGGSRRSCLTACRGEACLLARTLDAFCLDGARNPAHFWMRAPATAIAL